MGNVWKLETEADCEEGCAAGHLRIGRHRAVRGSASVGPAYVHYWCVDLLARWPPSPHRQTGEMRRTVAETGVESTLQLWAGKDLSRSIYVGTSASVIWVFGVVYSI